MNRNTDGFFDISLRVWVVRDEFASIEMSLLYNEWGWTIPKAFALDTFFASTPFVFNVCSMIHVVFEMDLDEESFQT